MRIDKNHFRIGLTLLVVALAGCAGPAPPPEPTPPPPPSEVVPPATPAPPAPPAEPAAAPAPTPEPSAANLPAVESMQPATPSAKLSVAVDLRYQFAGAVLENQPVTLHLAAIPRVPGANLRVNVKESAGFDVTAGGLTVQKASAAGVYRQQIAVTRRAGAPPGLRVLVTMDMPEGVAFGFFTIPLDSGPTAQKRDSVKQH